jgi:membrane-associated phospholipid phosphatase
VWFRYRERIRSWYVAVLTLVALGAVLYVVYPAGPPWLGAEYRAVGQVDRLSTLGWQVLHLDGARELLGDTQRGSNPVAAMPSLHAAVPVLVMLFLWPVLRWRWRAALTAYAVMMASVLVYTGEHYVVDVAVGWLVAVVAVVIGRAVRRRRRPRETRPALVAVTRIEDEDVDVASRIHAGANPMLLTGLDTSMTSRRRGTRPT